MKLPKIRFKGRNSRTEKFIKQIWKISTGKSNTQDQTEDWKYPFFIRSDIVVKSNKFLFNEEAVITIGDWNIWKVFHYINGKYDLHQRCYKISDFKDIFWKYFYYYFSTKFYKRAMSMTAKATVDSVRLEMISDMLIRFPSLPEQEKIRSLFEQLDSQITKNQQKLEKLKNMKQSFLQKLFPKAWARVPELRFKGFVGAWEERKIDNICNRFDNLRIPISAKNRIPGPVPYYWANGIQDYVDWYTHNWEFLLIAEDWANDLKNYPIQYVKWKIWVNNHAHVLQWKQELSNNMFLKYAIKHTNIESLLVWWWRAKLNASVLMWIPISLPSLPEQEKIWAFFEKLDTQITQQSQKIQKLQNLKQSLLEKMFI